jgi:hypothetical protein
MIGDRQARLAWSAIGVSILPGNARSPTARVPASRSQGRSAPRSISRCAVATARPTAMTASGRGPRSASSRTAPAPERAYAGGRVRRASRSWRTPPPFSVAPDPSPGHRRPSWSRSSPGRTHDCRESDEDFFQHRNPSPVGPKEREALSRYSMTRSPRYGMSMTLTTPSIRTFLRAAQERCCQCRGKSAASS